MRCKKIFIFTILLLFLAMQVVPLGAKNQPQNPTQDVDPIIIDPNADPNGGGEEHPWEDNEDDGDIGISDGKTSLDIIISQFLNLFKGGDKLSTKKSSAKKDSQSRRGDKLPFKKFK